MKKLSIYLLLILFSACAIVDDRPVTDEGSGAITDYNQLWKDRVSGKSVPTASFDKDANLTYLTETYTFDSSIELGKGIYKKDGMFYGVIAGADITKLLSMTKTGVVNSADIDWDDLDHIVVPDYNQLWKERVSGKNAGTTSFDNNANLTYLTETYTFDSSIELGKGIYKKGSLYYGVIASEDITKLLNMTKTGVVNSVDINWDDVKSIIVPVPDPETPEEQFKTAIQTMTSFYGQTISVDINGKFSAKGTNYTYMSVKNATQAVYSVGVNQFVGIAIVNSTIKMYQDSKVTPWSWASYVKFDSKHEFYGFTDWTEYSPLTGIKYDFEVLDMKIINNIPYVMYITRSSSFDYDVLSLRKPLKEWTEIANELDFPIQNNLEVSKFITDNNDMYLSTSAGDTLYKKNGNKWNKITEIKTAESVDVYNQTSYMVYRNEKNNIITLYLCKNTGTDTWSKMGEFVVSTSSTIDVYFFDIHIQDEKNIYINYREQEGKYGTHKIRKWDGNNFLPPLEVGSGRDLFEKETDYTIYNNKLYVIFSNDRDLILIKSTTGSSWLEEIKIEMDQIHSTIRYPKLRIYNDIMYIGTIQSATAYIYKYENSTLNTIKTLPEWGYFDMEISDDNRLFFIHNQQKNGIMTIHSTQL